MSNTLDQERREFDELCKNNPNYPRDFELHRKYQSHIKKWKPLIESNDPSIYSEWGMFHFSRRYDDPVAELLKVLMSTEVFTSGFRKYGDVGMAEISSSRRPGSSDELLFGRFADIIRQSHKVRREVMMLLLKSYVYYIEQKEEDNPWFSSDMPKKYLIKDLDRIYSGVPLSMGGLYSDTRRRNPFDISYYLLYTTRRLRNKERDIWETVKAVLAVCAIIFWIIAYVVSLLDDTDV